MYDWYEMKKIVILIPVFNDWESFKKLIIEIKAEKHRVREIIRRTYWSLIDQFLAESLEHFINALVLSRTDHVEFGLPPHRKVFDHCYCHLLFPALTHLSHCICLVSEDEDDHIFWSELLHLFVPGLLQIIEALLVAFSFFNQNAAKPSTLAPKYYKIRYFWFKLEASLNFRF